MCPIHGEILDTKRVSWYPHEGTLDRTVIEGSKSILVSRKQALIFGIHVPVPSSASKFGERVNPRHRPLNYTT
jgi:hypothetical protein